MPAAARAEFEDQISTGHGCDAVADIEGTLQTTVRINGFLAAVKGDKIAPHTIPAGPLCVPHSSVINEGSSTVTIGGIPAARVGDSADAGQVITGSGNVTIGG